MNRPIQGGKVRTFFRRLGTAGENGPRFFGKEGMPVAVYHTESRQQTVELGRRLAQTLSPGSLVLFTGGLGAGKTAFCEGIAQGLGCADPASSPTFTIVNYYRGPRPFAHFDLYRLQNQEDLEVAGFYDYLDQGAVVAAEWSENFADLLADEKAVRVDIQVDGENSRTITIEGETI